MIMKMKIKKMVATIHEAKFVRPLGGLRHLTIFLGFLEEKNRDICVVFDSTK